MPRGHRFHLDGQVYHITDRCHRKQFLLKFARDRRAWTRWLYEARRRYGLRDLNMVRAGAVAHPREWRDAGYQEIQNPPQRYWIIDRKELSESLGVDETKLAELRRQCLRYPERTEQRQLVFFKGREPGRKSEAPLAVIEAMKRKVDSVPSFGFCGVLR